jgi:uncharacterized lipoprotein YddW (UPF0748 family)
MKHRLPLLTEHLIVPLLALLILSACIPQSSRDLSADPPGRGQTLPQLHLPEQETDFRAAWIPYFICERLLSEPDEAACRAQITDYLIALRERGIRAVFVHICPFGEMLFPSEYYPLSAAAGGHDAAALFADACEAADMSLHLWLNPLRLQTEDAMALHHDDSRLSQIFRDPQRRERCIFVSEGRCYLNPAAEETADFLGGAVTELLRHCPTAAGVHIDDYFYPSPETAADAALFSASGEKDLAAWRRGRVSALVKRLCGAVHAAKDGAVFSVSPQGNLPLNRDTLFADVTRWLAEPGYCDMMLPQLYFGYENETCPFKETLAEWAALPRAEGVRLAAGLAAYKTGERDDFAGSGAEEWQKDGTVLQREIADVCADAAFTGIGLYHSDAVLAQDVTLPCGAGGHDSQVG